VIVLTVALGRDVPFKVALNVAVAFTMVVKPSLVKSIILGVEKLEEVLVMPTWRKLSEVKPK
jgi:hypothetical protein